MRELLRCSYSDFYLKLFLKNLFLMLIIENN